MSIPQRTTFMALAFLATTIIAGAKQPRAKFAGFPTVIGNIQAVSAADLRAAITDDHLLDRVSFIRVVNRDNLQLHHESRGDRCEHYDDMRRKKGKWVYRGTVVVVEGCGYVPM